jgi:23S rRNA (adenine2503-C2)-methyltransferase
LKNEKNDYKINNKDMKNKIEKLKNDLDVSLAISLHAVSNEVRNNLVPINRKWPIEKLLEVLTNYPGVNNSRRITFEYVMLEGINDTINDAKALVKLLKFIPAKVNLIPFNPWPGSTYKCSSIEVINKFADLVCSDGGIVATVRQPRGQDILAACGQLKSDSVRSKNNFKKLN